MPVASVAVPRRGYVPFGAVPDLYVFGMSAGAGAEVGVQYADGDVVGWCDGAVVGAGNRIIRGRPTIQNPAKKEGK